MEPSQALAISAPQVQSDPEHGLKLRKLVAMTRDLNQIGWGAHGDMTGAIETVDISRIWPNPLRVIHHSQAEVMDMKESLQVEGQKDPIVLAYAKAPPSLAGYEECDLLIVDGDLRYLGRLKQGEDTIKAIIQPFTSMTQIMIDSAVRTLHRVIPTPLQVGQFIMRIKVTQQRERESNPATPKAPTQIEFARMFGKSQPTISAWCSLAEEPLEIVELIDSGELSTTQARELMVIHRVDQRIEEALRVAGQNMIAQVPVKQVREAAIRLTMPRKVRPISFDDEVEPDMVEISDLAVTALPDSSPRVMVLQALLFDTHEQLAEQLAQVEKPHPALKKLADALEDEAIMRFMGEN